MSYSFCTSFRFFQLDLAEWSREKIQTVNKNRKITTQLDLSKPTFTCSKSINRNTRAIMWNLFNVTKKDTRMTSLMSFWCLYCKLWTDFIHCSGVSIVDFEQVNTRWVCIFRYLANIAQFALVFSNQQSRTI